MTQHERSSQYSLDLWDYLVEMRHMPSRDDRDALVRKSAVDAAKKRRVQLWDYFFRINPDEVGQPQKKEIAELENQARTAHARHNQEGQRLRNEIQAQNNSLARIREELSSYSTRIEEESRQKILRSRSRNKSLGIVALVCAGVSFMVAVLMAAGIIGDSVLGSIIGASALLCGGTVALFAGLIAAALLLPLLQGQEEKIRSRVAAENAKQTPRLLSQEAEYSQRLATFTQQSQAETDGFNSYVRQSTARIQSLRDEVSNLVQQIPKPPSDQEVEGWFSEDLAALREIALDRRGLRERLIPIAGSENPINIYGPVELQQPEMIPPPFKVEGSDRNKHMQVRKFVLKPDGAFVAFHGVYNVEYVLVAKDVLFTYGTTWDFTTGEQSGERADEINYTKITSILTLKSYREIQMEEGNVAMENAPSLTLNLENGKSYVVTFPDLAYLKLTNAPSFDPENWESDQTDAVENAIKVISEQKRIAQNLLTS